jgi:hypothetical protein
MSEVSELVDLEPHCFRLFLVVLIKLVSLELLAIELDIQLVLESLFAIELLRAIDLQSNMFCIFLSEVRFVRGL